MNPDKIVTAIAGLRVLEQVAEGCGKEVVLVLDPSLMAPLTQHQQEAARAWADAMAEELQTSAQRPSSDAQGSGGRAGLMRCLCTVVEDFRAALQAREHVLLREQEAELGQGAVATLNLAHEQELGRGGQPEQVAPHGPGSSVGEAPERDSDGGDRADEKPPAQGAGGHAGANSSSASTLLAPFSSGRAGQKQVRDGLEGQTAQGGHARELEADAASLKIPDAVMEFGSRATETARLDTSRGARATSNGAVGSQERDAVPCQPPAPVTSMLQPGYEAALSAHDSASKVHDAVPGLPGVRFGPLPVPPSPVLGTPSASGEHLRP